MTVRIEKLNDENFEDCLTGRSAAEDEAVTAAVRAIIADVVERGDEAVAGYTGRFDNVDLRPDQFRIDPAEFEAALASIPATIRAGLELAAARIKDFHRRQMPESWLMEKDGARLGQRVTPISRVGLYVPGGRASYPSSVLMNAIPARIAGVEEIALCVPPDKDGQVSPYVLAAAAIAGVDELYRVGGAQAIAALAYGTETIKAVDKITGPGNIYVATAKRLVIGQVDIDMIAGPSEVAIIADGRAPAAFIAADMIAQAEHDPLATAILLTDDAGLARAVGASLDEQLETAPRAGIARESLANNGRIYIVDDFDTAIAFINRFAPEHLEIMTADPENLLPRIKHAGAIFLGDYTPEALGDYVAGTNHVLPTASTARFYSPLGVYDFLKWSSVLAFSREATGAIGAHAVRLAEIEGLSGHARSVELRLSQVGTPNIDGDSDGDSDGDTLGHRISLGVPTRNLGVPTTTAAGASTRQLLPPREAVAGLTAYDPQHHQVRINLSANENSYGLPDRLRDGLAELVKGLDFNRYPDPAAAELRRAIAGRHGVDPAQVAVGNGGDELIQALLLAYGGPGRAAAAFTPTFAMYDILSRTTGTDFVALERDETFAVPADAPDLVESAGGRIVFVCSPNNPTGNVIDADAARALADRTDGLVVIDEAYQEFSRTTALGLLPRCPNLIVLRTFSKAFSLAGLRVGYVIADPRVIENLNKVRLPYNVNAFSQAAAAALLREPGPLMEIIAEIVSERDRLAGAIDGLEGYNVYPSGGNFLLVECARPGDEVWRGLLDAGILVRNFSRTPRLKNCVRITVGTPAQNDAVIEALAERGGK